MNKSAFCYLLGIILTTGTALAQYVDDSVYNSGNPYSNNSDDRYFTTGQKKEKEKAEAQAKAEAEARAKEQLRLHDEQVAKEAYERGYTQGQIDSSAQMEATKKQAEEEIEKIRTEANQQIELAKNEAKTQIEAAQQQANTAKDNSTKIEEEKETAINKAVEEYKLQLKKEYDDSAKKKELRYNNRYLTAALTVSITGTVAGGTAGALLLIDAQKNAELTHIDSLSGSQVDWYYHHSRAEEIGAYVSFGVAGAAIITGIILGTKHHKLQKQLQINAAVSREVSMLTIGKVW